MSAACTNSIRTACTLTAGGVAVDPEADVLIVGGDDMAVRATASHSSAQTPTALSAECPLTALHCVWYRYTRSTFYANMTNELWTCLAEQ